MEHCPSVLSQIFGVRLLQMLQRCSELAKCSQIWCRRPKNLLCVPAAPKSPKPCLLKTQTLCSALPFLVLLSGWLTIMMIMNDDPGWDLVDQAEYHEDTDDEKLYIVLPTV